MSVAIKQLASRLDQIRGEQEEKRKRAEEYRGYLNRALDAESALRRAGDEIEQAIADLKAVNRRRAIHGGTDPVTG